MLSLNSILTELSEERINQVAVSGIEAAGGEDERTNSSSRSRSGRRPVPVRRGRRARPVRRRRRFGFGGGEG